MNIRTFTPSDFTQMPSLGSFQNIDYDWERQSRVTNDAQTIYCGSKQTFDISGKPNDSTNSSGSTQQTFNISGVPNDSKRD